MGNIDLLVDRIKDAVGPNLDDQKDLRDKLLAGSPFTLRDMCVLSCSFLYPPIDMSANLLLLFCPTTVLFSLNSECAPFRYEQFQNILKMGPLNKVMEAIPGFSQMLKQTGGSGKDFDSGQKIRSYITMMDSMTDAELDDNRVRFCLFLSLSHFIFRRSYMRLLFG
jgi:hypothetical protein